MKRFILFFILSIIILVSCKKDTYTFRIFPYEPVNMDEFNSEYDDYNSYLEIIGDSGPFCFSSNRNSKGSNFDLICKILAVYMSKSRSGVDLTVTDHDYVFENANIAPGFLNWAVSNVNTSYNELGPYLIPQGKTITSYYHASPEYDKYILLYASDESGNLDIQYTVTTTDQFYSTPKKISFCNSSNDDAYPSVFPDSSSVYFCSDRDGDFNIYKVALSGTVGFINSLNDPSEREVTKVTELSSGYNDKCPFIAGNLLVFTSDRPGGYGGFDLYYSLYNGSTWSSPVNFGEKINSGYDEYRPIVKNFGTDFENDFMIFSSNRPGGKGGYDLFYAGINKMTE
jgi:hypothetical protein